MKFTIRTANEHDFKFLPEIENNASEAFTPYTDFFIEGTPPDEDFYHSLKDHDFVLVAETQNKIIGFCVCMVVDAMRHLEEISVDLPYMNKGVGAALLKAVEESSKAQGFFQLALTTFLEIPFNGAFYQKNGFEVIAPEKLFSYPDLNKLIANEKEEFQFIPYTRVAMIKRL